MPPGTLFGKRICKDMTSRVEALKVVHVTPILSYRLKFVLAKREAIIFDRV